MNVSLAQMWAQGQAGPQLEPSGAEFHMALGQARDQRPGVTAGG